MKIKILVRMKDDVPDPQGAALKERLARLGFGEIKRARIGRLIEFELDKVDRDTAGRRTKEMCEDLLANPVYEEYEILELE